MKTWTVRYIEDESDGSLLAENLAGDVISVVRQSEQWAGRDAAIGDLTSDVRDIYLFERETEDANTIR